MYIFSRASAMIHWHCVRGPSVSIRHDNNSLTSCRIISPGDCCPYVKNMDIGQRTRIQQLCVLSFRFGVLDINDNRYHLIETNRQRIVRNVNPSSTVAHISNIREFELPLSPSLTHTPCHLLLNN